MDENGSKTLRYRYTYDEADQLVRTDDNVAGKTYVYTYNKGGNRIMSKVYAYTLGAELGKMQSGDTALYTDPLWRDRMTSFNGKLITYDKLGNPKTYDGNTYTWEGRQLKSVSNSDGKTQFIYDADGLRTETRVYDKDNKLQYTDKYIWKDGVIDSHVLIATGITETAKYLYDANNQIVGYTLDSGETLMFIKNIQGDVIALVDETGKVKVEYQYDAWGNMTCIPRNGVTQGHADYFAIICPITYRGYNYDVSTGLYYLQSRYYSPEWGRFLNCDDTNILLATQGETHNANLFAYCSNNPINKIDPTGYKEYSDGELLGMLAFAAVTFDILDLNGYSEMLDNEIMGFDYSIDSHELAISRIVFRNKLKQYKCIKVILGTIISWSEYENISRLSPDEIMEMLHEGKKEMEIYYSKEFGVHSKWREDPWLNTAVNILIPTGYAICYSFYFPTMIINNISYKNSYTYEWILQKNNGYDGMYAIAKTKTKFTKKQYNKFLNDESIPSHSDIKIFGGI